jgi:hypothetical protein
MIQPGKMFHQFDKNDSGIADTRDLTQRLWRRIEDSLDRSELLEKGNRKGSHVFLRNGKSQEQLDEALLCQSAVFSQ